MTNNAVAASTADPKRWCGSWVSKNKTNDAIRKITVQVIVVTREARRLISTGKYMTPKIGGGLAAPASHSPVHPSQNAIKHCFSPVFMLAPFAHLERIAA